jgi:predicted HD phosphohydrolase
MTATEAQAFEKDALFEVSIKMRQWDEQAKEENIALPDLNIYKQMCLDVLERS